MRSTKLLIFSCFLLICRLALAQINSITSGDVQRTYMLHLPTGFTASDTLPLVLNLHGLTQNGQAQSELSGFDTIADREKFIVVHPNGINATWNALGGTYFGGTDDVGFLSDLIDSINRDYHINLSRVYSTGMSNGGFMSYRLACDLSNRIAAIASVTGSMTDSMLYYCNPSRPVPILHMHGTNDPIVNYNGSGNIQSVNASLQYWINYNNCPGTPVTTAVPDAVASDNCTASEIYYGTGNQQSEVIHYKIQNGGHTWPGSGNTFFGIGGNVNMDIKANEIIWEFFNRHSLQGGINAVNEPTFTESTVNVFPNPVGDIMNVEWTDVNVSTVQLTDLSGKILMETIPAQGQKSVKLSVKQLPTGIYLSRCASNKGTRVLKVVKE